MVDLMSSKKINGLLDGVETLEVKVAYQEYLLDQLNQQVIELRQQNDQMQRRLQQIIEWAVPQMQQAPGSSASIERPPHY